MENHPSNTSIAEAYGELFPPLYNTIKKLYHPKPKGNPEQIPLTKGFNCFSLKQTQYIGFPPSNSTYVKEKHS